MYRIDGADTAVALPTPAAAGGGGYFTDAAPGANTVVTADWLNAVQEELADLVITVGGVALDKADVNQLSVILGHVRAIRSHATSLSNASSPHTRSLVASTLSTASGDKSAVVGSTSSSATGANSAVVGSAGCQATQTDSAVIASSSCATSSGTECAIISSTDSADVSNTRTMVAASKGGVASGNTSAVIACHNTGTAAATASGTTSAVIASDSAGSALSPTASGNMSAVVACDGSVASGAKSAAIASVEGAASGAISAVVATEACLARGGASFVGASYDTDVWTGTDRSAAWTSQGSFVSASQAFLVGSTNAEIAEALCIAGGYSVAGIAQSGSDQNVKWKISSQTGKATIQSLDVVAGGVALGGGAGATLGTIGGSGPTVAGQAQWLQIDIGGVTHWVPAWV